MFFGRGVCLLTGLAMGMSAEVQPVRSFFAAEASGLRIVAPAVPGEPWTVAGEQGALFGRQNGVFEAWQWPVKLLSHFRIEAELADYAVPIDVNALAAQIEVRPEETIITYSHAAFTVRQHLLAARGSGTAAAATAVVFEVEAARPLALTFSFTPDMLAMWPAPNHGRPNGEWVADGSSGFYVLHTDDPSFSGLVAMPRTQPGIQVPYQEHPQTYPLELKLAFDPKRDAGFVFPLVMRLLGKGAAKDEMKAALESIPQMYRETHEYYEHFFDSRLTIETPDKRLNEAYRWAALAIDQAQVRYHDETGLVAGYYESADSARPGYAWFFGRDTLWTSYAINSYGDFALTRRALDFLIRRQRADGKMMHEYSQSADALDWTKTPYFYASADATPLFVMAMWDYVKASGDAAYLEKNWDAVKKAYAFTRAHTANDGIYSNSEGTGWVESWPQGMPKEEIYLAAVDEQSAMAMTHLAGLMKQEELAAEARKTASAISGKIESEYYEAQDKFYAFSRNGDGTLDRTASVYPAVAWWDGTFGLKQAGPMLTRWATPEFSADWGTRDISERTAFYDPISYHQGSIWPLFTGWAAQAEYRAGRPLAGYAHLMQNADLTWVQDLGAVTELLSGEFYQPLGRSSSHQLWSSAMVVTPLVRGLFGIDVEAAAHRVRLTPHLPAEWDGARLGNVKVGDSICDLTYRRAGERMTVTAAVKTGPPVCLGMQQGCSSTDSYALPGVELVMPAALPGPGAETAQLKVIDEEYGERAAMFQFAGQGGAEYDVKLRLNRVGVRANGGEIRDGQLHLKMAEGSGYQDATVRFRW